MWNPWYGDFGFALDDDFAFRYARIERFQYDFKVFKFKRILLCIKDLNCINI